jgi:hypothetical protein
MIRHDVTRELAVAWREIETAPNSLEVLLFSNNGHDPCRLASRRGAVSGRATDQPHFIR